MNNRYFLSLLMSILNTSLLYSQSIDKKPGAYLLPAFNLESPTKYKHQQYDAFPVSEYTGSANIDVPLYQIQLGDMSYPISLKYSGSRGIKVSEEASWVGLGWNLSFGDITQFVYGLDDLLSEDLSRTYFLENKIYPNGVYDPKVVRILNCDDYNFGVPLYAKKPCNPVDLYNYQKGLMRDNKAYQSVKSYYSYWISVGYNTGASNNYSSINWDEQYDLEPDIFSVNIFGENLLFLI